MFAFFGLGVQEILILAVLGALVVVPVLIIVLLRSGGSSARETALEEENRRLRADLDRQRDRD